MSRESATGNVVSNAAGFLSLQQRFEELFQENQAAVVRVKGVYQPSAATGDKPASTLVQAGTGFFTSNNGLVLTTASNVTNASEVFVEYQGVDYSANVLGVDLLTNLAFLKLDKLPKRFGFISLNPHASLPAVCTFNLVIAYPRSCALAPKPGMISGRDGNYEDRVFPTYYLRTTSLACDGEHGAPVFDLQGRLLGVLIASAPEIQSSYILPTRAILRLREDILSAGRVSYGYVGIEVAQPVGIGHSSIVIISNVHKDSPAYEAGLRTGDELIKFGDFSIRDMNDVRNAAFFAQVGEYIDVVVNRQGNQMHIPIRVGDPGSSKHTLQLQAGINTGTS